jgi:xanthine dehydrogenase YagR molybdenum-binding subunit
VIGETYVDMLRRAGQPFVEVDLTTGSPLEMMKYSMHSYAAHFCEAAVHGETGELRIRRWVGAFDTGRIRNPSLAEYHVPVHADIPEIDILYTERL